MSDHTHDQHAHDHDHEHHFIHRTGWLRAAVLGANDGIVSIASLLIGVAAAAAGKEAILVAGMAGLVAGAMSMAAGEYVSVSSQADTEKADLDTEREALESNPQAELVELAAIYEARGVDHTLSLEVARQLMDHDALDAHAKDELGLYELTAARPIQAAGVSALSFAAGAALPFVAAIVSPTNIAVVVIAVASLISLALLGVVSASAGGAGRTKAALRVVFWGAAAMLLTGIIGHLFGIALE